MAHGWCHNFWVTFGVNEKTNSIREALDEALLNWPLGSEEDSILSLLQVILQKYITFPELNHGYFFFFNFFFYLRVVKFPLISMGAELDYWWGILRRAYFWVFENTCILCILLVLPWFKRWEIQGSNVGDFKLFDTMPWIQGLSSMREGGGYR